MSEEQTQPPSDISQDMRDVAQKVRDRYELAWGRSCDCTTINGAFHYGYAQGLEFAAELVAASEALKP